MIGRLVVLVLSFEKINLYIKKSSDILYSKMLQQIYPLEANILRAVIDRIITNARYNEGRLYSWLCFKSKYVTKHKLFSV